MDSLKELSSKQWKMWVCDFRRKDVAKYRDLGIVCLLDGHGDEAE